MKVKIQDLALTGKVTPQGAGAAMAKPPATTAQGQGSRAPRTTRAWGTCRASEDAPEHLAMAQLLWHGTQLSTQYTGVTRAERPHHTKKQRVLVTSW